MFYGDWEFSTPQGRFRLVRSRGNAVSPPSPDDLRTLLFFAQGDLEFSNEARRAAVALLASIGSGYRTTRDVAWMGPQEFREVIEQIRFAVECGALQFEKRHPIRTRAVAISNAIPTQESRADEETEESTFKVTFVDETGAVIPGFKVAFTQGQKTLSNESANPATFQGEGSFGSIRPEAFNKFREVVGEVLKLKRTPKAYVPVTGQRLVQVTLGTQFDSIPIEAGEWLIVQIMPELGRIYLKLFDKTGRHEHKGCDYTITGPASFQGKTDDNAELCHDGVVPGKYTLHLKVGKETLNAPATVLRAGTGEPQIRKLGVLPDSTMVSVRQFVFAKNKSFILPASLNDLRTVRERFLATSPSDVLIVGHTDTLGDPKTNDPLSLDCADCTKALLLGDVDSWLAMYEGGGKAGLPWGKDEDAHMLGRLPDYGSKPQTESAINWFQRTRGLKVNGVCEPTTRKQLITEYMALVGEPLTNEPEFTSRITTHGCGENFPLDDSGDQLDAAAKDGVEDAKDRRVEFFFFDHEYGIQPAPPAQNSKAGSAAYPQWRKQLQHQTEMVVPPVPPPQAEQLTDYQLAIVDETGTPVAAAVPLLLTIGSKPSEPATTDAQGVLRFSTDAASIKVGLGEVLAVQQIMAAIWQGRPPTSESQYAPAGSNTSVALLRAAGIETPDGKPFAPITLDSRNCQHTICIQPAKKRAVVIEMPDALFRNDSAVVNPEGEAPSNKVGQHESISSVGLIATILRYNEEHPGKKLFIGGHTDRAGTESSNVALSEHRAKAVLALIEGKKTDYVAACKAKHSEVDVTQLMDWTNKQYSFKCKPTKLTAAPSDENYYLFRKSYNEWCAGAVDTANGEIGPRGIAIGQYGRLQDDIWSAMFDLYEHNLRQELGEETGGVDTLRGEVKWVSDGKKFVGYGETHPTAENAIDGTRSQADRRVEVFLFDENELPDLAATNGADVYDGVTFKKKTVEPLVSARRLSAKWAVTIPTWVDNAGVVLWILNGSNVISRIPLGSASVVGNCATFDLSNLDPAPIYRLELRQGQLLLSPPMIVSLPHLRWASQLSDVQAMAGRFLNALFDQ